MLLSALELLSLLRVGSSEVRNGSLCRTQLRSNTIENLLHLLDSLNLLFLKIFGEFLDLALQRVGFRFLFLEAPLKLLASHVKPAVARLEIQLCVTLGLDELGFLCRKGFLQLHPFRLRHAGSLCKLCLPLVGGLDRSCLELARLCKRSIQGLL